MKTFYFIMLNDKFLSTDLSLTDNIGDAIIFTDLNFAKELAGIIEEDATIILIETNVSFKKIEYDD